MPRAQQSPSPLFTRSITANINYWQERTSEMSHENLSRIDRDRQNLFRAARFGLQLDETWRATADLILQTYILIERRGYWSEWIPLLEQLLGRCEAGDLSLRGRLLDQLGLFYRQNRELEKALAAHQEELKIGLALGDQWRQAHAAINLGTVLRQMRRFSAAQDHILQAQTAFQSIDVPIIKHAFVMLELGLLAQDQGQWKKAEEHLTYSVALWREVGDPAYLANCLKLLGQVMVAQGKTAVAAQLYREALDLLEPTTSNLDKARLLNELGVLHLKQTDLAAARRYLLDADAQLSHQTGNLHIQAVVTTNIGNLYLALGQLQAAQQAYQNSINLWDAYADQIQYANALGGLAEVKTEQGEFESAKQLYQQALTILIDFPDDAWGQKLQIDYKAALTDLCNQQVLNKQPGLL